MFGNNGYDLMAQFGGNAEALGNLAKALQTGDDIVVGGATGGPALRLQNLDKTMQLTTWGENKIKLFKALHSTPIEGPVDEWTYESEYGGPFGGTVAELQNPVFTDPQLTRTVGQAKFYMSARQVSGQILMTKNIQNARAVQEVAGARYIMGNVERDLFFGDPAMVPTEMVGLLPAILATGDADQVVDMHGTYFSDSDMIQQAAAVISDRAGVATHMFYDPLSQGDLNNALKAAQRYTATQVNPDGTLTADANITGLYVAGGKLMLQDDFFLSPHRGYINPVTDNDKLYLAPTTARGGDASSPAPAAPTVTAGSPTGTDADATNLPAGKYIYRVTAFNGAGESASVASAEVTVTAKQHVPLTIVTADSTVTCYRIYRSPKHASAADTTNCRFLTRVAATAGGTTVWNDTGEFIPGTTMAFMVDCSPDNPAIDWRQWLPMTKFALANLVFGERWLQMLFGYQRITKPRRLVVFKNIVPSQLATSWAPLG